MTEDILFIQSPGKHDVIYESIEQFGEHIINPFKGDILPLRLIRELWFSQKILPPNIWFNKQAKCNVKTIIVHEPLITSAYIKWLKRKNPNSRIIFMYTNVVSNNKRISPEEIKNAGCQAWSTDVFDCDEYKMDYVHGYYFSQLKVHKEKTLYDVFYIGKDKGRVDSLFLLKNQMNNLGLKTYFHIVAPRRYLKFKNKFYKEPLLYDEVRSYLSKSKAILCLSKGAQKGLTLRVMESLFNEIKLITDDQTIVDFEFYRKNNIFVLGRDDLAQLPQFLQIPYEKIEPSVLEKYTFENWLKEYII